MNNSEWLTAENFEYAHRAVSAINTLSIHAETPACREAGCPEKCRGARGAKLLT